MKQLFSSAKKCNGFSNNMVRKSVTAFRRLSTTETKIGLMNTWQYTVYIYTVRIPTPIRCMCGYILLYIVYDDEGKRGEFSPMGWMYQSLDGLRQ